MSATKFFAVNAIAFIIFFVAAWYGYLPKFVILVGLVYFFLAGLEYVQNY